MLAFGCPGDVRSGLLNAVTAPTTTRIRTFLGRSAGRRDGGASATTQVVVGKVKASCQQQHRRRTPRRSEDQMANAGVVIGAVAQCVVAAAVLSGCSGHPASMVGSSNAQSAGPSSAHTAVAGKIRDDQPFTEYTASDRSYTVKIPQGWSQSTAGSEVMFTDKSDVITLSPRAGFYEPTEAYARVVEVRDIARTAKRFALVEVTTVQRRAGPVILVAYRAQFAPDPITGTSVPLDVQRYEFAEPGRRNEVVVTLSEPAGADNVAAWRLITDSFSWLP